ncbi:MAG: hypothetical protein FWC27_12765 [Firmicutes bacterium]|nr:hypothetical protein [Bacillota bacterium]
MPYYHGSPVAGIQTLAPPPGGVVYLTNCRAYALFYIRDLEVNHVTCGVRNGVVLYDEQFPGQLRALYAGRGGWLYACEGNGFAPGKDPWIVTAGSAVTVASAEHIPNAYEAILREIEAGAVRVDSYEGKTAERRRDITEMMVRLILQDGYLSAATPRARFFERSFPEAWALAQQNTPC